MEKSTVVCALAFLLPFSVWSATITTPVKPSVNLLTQSELEAAKTETEEPVTGEGQGTTDEAGPSDSGQTSSGGGDEDTGSEVDNGGGDSEGGGSGGGQTPITISSGPLHSTSDYVLNPTNAPAVDGAAVSYSAIAAQAPPEFCFEFHNEYLGEFLRQNPTTYWWHQDQTARTITPLGEPVFTPEQTITITPSGGDDTDAIKAAAKAAGKGGVVDGRGGTFRVDNLILTAAYRGVTFRDINMVPFKNSATFLVKIGGTDITFIRCLLDMQGGFFLYGFFVLNTADRFALVDSGVINLNNNRSLGSAALRIYEQVDDVYIVGNRFENLIGEGSTGSRIRAIRIGGPDQAVHPKRGIMALNHFENLQSKSKGNDADSVVVQGFPGSNASSAAAGGTNVFDGNLLFMANTMIDGGKRMIKLQSGGVDLHSNHSWYKSTTGPLGPRVTRTHYDNQGTSNARWTNNVGVSDNLNAGGAESFFMTITTRRWDGDMLVKNNVYKCNVYELNESTTNRKNYAFFVFDYLKDGPAYWPEDSEISNNVVRGTGELAYHFWFRRSPADVDHDDKTGTAFPHTGNVFSVSTVNGPYKL